MQWERHRWLSEFSPLGIGGRIAYFASPSSREEMGEGLFFAKEQALPLLIIGRGSNCLFSDEGFPGVVLLNQMQRCSWDRNRVSVEGGYSFLRLGKEAARKGLGGLEFACGVPGSVGGAVYMNAGACGQETAHCLQSVRYMDGTGSEKEYKANELQFSYRTSPFQKLDGVILEALFQLREEEGAWEQQRAMIRYRLRTQPLRQKNIGSIFRNPLGQGAGRLIEQCGCKGHRIGDALVSPIHANFIVNRGKATAQEVYGLIRWVQDQVLEKKGISLELEIKLIGYHGVSC